MIPVVAVNCYSPHSIRVQTTTTAQYKGVYCTFLGTMEVKSLKSVKSFKYFCYRLTVHYLLKDLMDLTINTCNLQKI